MTKCKTCNQELPQRKWLKVPELGIEVEIEVHDKGKSWNELNLNAQEDKLLTAEQCMFLVNHKKYSKILKMDGSSTEDDFYIQQPFKLNRKNGYVARFFANSDSVLLYCVGGADYSSFNRGVRFVHTLSKRERHD